MSEIAKNWANYPMGPALRGQLGLDDSDYQGDKAARPDDETAVAFAKDLISFFSSQPIADYYDWVDVLEELTAMGLSSCVRFLAEEDYRTQADHDFRAQLAIGSAYMLEGDDQQSLFHLHKAHELQTAELAPYVNIASIHYAFERDQDARRWAEAGLQIDGNQNRLWEILASVWVHEDKATAGERLKAFAESIDSYLGLSLAADMIDPNDALLKAQYLEPILNSDKVDGDFLIEYTAVLGMAMQFEKIPSVIWKAERISGISIPWKVYAHGAQAYLAQNDHQNADSMIKSLKAMADAPRELIDQLEHEQKELAGSSV